MHTKSLVRSDFDLIVLAHQAPLSHEFPGKNTECIACPPP